jgi:hypothetical protein
VSEDRVGICSNFWTIPLMESEVGALRRFRLHTNNDDGNDLF